MISGDRTVVDGNSLYDSFLDGAAAPTSEDKAATVIQKYFIGHQARKSYLPRNLYLKYQAQCEKALGPASDWMPQASEGKTRVFLPKETPEVVLKMSGREEAIERFHQMQDVRAVLRSQKSSHLIIPEARLCQEFLVERRLPINTDSYHNMELYLSQPKLFDEAVREMTRLFSKRYISDLVSYQLLAPLGHIPGVGDFIRYDNLPMYVVEENGKKVGKIGLIDLEHTINVSAPEGLEELVRIFPFHLDVIKEEASKLQMEFKEDALSVSMEKGKKYLQVGFTDHSNWLTQKGVSTKVSFQPFEISLQRIEELTVVIEEELQKLNEGTSDLFTRKHFMPKHFFTESPEKMAKELSVEITSMLVNNIKNLIKNTQEYTLRELSGQREMTSSQLVSLRSPVVRRRLLYKNVATLLLNHPKIDLQDTCDCEELLGEQLLEALMKELVKGGEIFYYDPGYYTGEHNGCWIRY